MKIASESLASVLAFLTPPGVDRVARGSDAARQSSEAQNEASARQPIVDSFEISTEGQAALAVAEEEVDATPSETDGTESPIGDETQAGRSTKSGRDGPGSSQQAGVGELSEEEQEVVDELQARDREVRAHEQAHLAAAGPYAKGGPTYTYEEGPDGQQYAVGGEVSIDTSPVSGDPEATIQKAQVVRAAALAPAEPSAQDRAVAAAATKMEIQARQELREKETGQPSDETSVEAKLIDSVEELTAGLLLDLIA